MRGARDRGIAAALQPVSPVTRVGWVTASPGRPDEGICMHDGAEGDFAEFYTATWPRTLAGMAASSSTVISWPL